MYVRNSGCCCEMVVVVAAIGCLVVWFFGCLVVWLFLLLLYVRIHCSLSTVVMLLLLLLLFICLLLLLLVQLLLILLFVVVVAVAVGAVAVAVAVTVCFWQACDEIDMKQQLPLPVARTNPCDLCQTKTCRRGTKRHLNCERVQMIVRGLRETKRKLLHFAPRSWDGNNHNNNNNNNNNNNVAPSRVRGRRVKGRYIQVISQANVCH